MNLYFRFVWLFIRAFFNKNESLLLTDLCSTTFIVNPLDLDINLHMNNGRYLSIMDLARTDLMLKAGVFSRLFFKGYYPVVISESISFRKSLGLLQKFTIETQLNAWDEKNFYLIQTFKHRGTTVAEGYIKGRFLKRGQKGSIPTQELFKILNLNLQETNKSQVAMAHDSVDQLLAPRPLTIR